ncbi:MAG: DegV family protein [Dehalococcoidales bacterium]|nr:DegV family protein [Dehalococcoidales bacterium]MDD5605551.1 DegV family protein [Dehalococcoidales bacterium]
MNHNESISRDCAIVQAFGRRQAVHFVVMHARAEHEVRKLQERIAAEFNCRELWVTELSTVMRYAVGTGTVGFACYTG